MTFDPSILVPHLPFLLDGFLLTVGVCVVSIVGAAAIGTVVAILRVSRSALLRRLAEAYVDLFRNIPFIVQLFFFYYGLPEIGIYIDAFTTGCIALSIAAGAYASDIVRAGILSVDTGVIEAAQVSGLPRLVLFRKVVLPIALRASVRPLGSIFINLVLTSSILSTITLNELTGSAKIVASDTFRPFEVYFFLLLFYGGLTSLLSLSISLLHRRLNHYLAEA